MSSNDSAILLVEDNEDDVFLIKRALKAALVTAPVQVAADGREAIAYLSGTGKYKDRSLYPLPKFVFLDLKLPYISGFEVFAWIREHAELAASIMVILTSPPQTRDLEKVKELGTYACLLKPFEPETLAKILSV